MAEAVKDYQKLEHDIIRLAGGADNIASAQRCVTRLRLVLKNTPGQAEEKIKALPGVITVVQKQGQFQVVIGNHVGDVFEAVSAELETNKKTEQEERPKEKENLLNRLLQMISGVFAPVCYVLAAGGLLQGLLIILTMAVPSVTETGVYQVFNFISWTPFTFLPVLLAISASKHFHCNPYIAAACCLALVNPVWTEMAGKIAEGENIRFLFVNLTEITYTSSVLPPLILVALLSKLEKFLNKHLPELIKSLFTPLFCLAALVPLTIVVIGPLIQWLSNGVADGYNLLYQMAPPIAGAVVGGVWQVIVIFGIHWGMVPIVIANFAQNGQDTLQIFYSDCCNFTDGSCIWSIFNSKRQAAENRCTVRRNHRNFRNYRTGNLWDHTAEKETVYLWLYLGCNRKCNRCDTGSNTVCVCRTSGTDLRGKFHICGKSGFISSPCHRSSSDDYRNNRKYPAVWVRTKAKGKRRAFYFGTNCFQSADRRTQISKRRQ